MIQVEGHTLQKGDEWQDISFEATFGGHGCECRTIKVLHPTRMGGDIPVVPSCSYKQRGPGQG